MASTKDRALRAAVEEVGEHGIRALTHARVDARAGLPKGSTSNWFRTRAALLAGVVEHLAQEERAIAPDREVTTPDDLVELIAVTGYYDIVSMTLNVAGVELPEGEPLPLKPLR